MGAIFNFDTKNFCDQPYMSYSLIEYLNVFRRYFRVTQEVSYENQTCIHFIKDEF